ncbi:hypothetical protein CTAYLR_008683 [Chrysophaeum taylorii]|uniref:RanBP2-type domain-containing protein n=1 Tax=Chrysophaeum taylorii TaxID=2483200 RepID=A0AAD7XRV0_9STRA|nr:hypothetical protein CTAYLR_008683 [Chrysophaeum taylorii]
MRWECQCCRRWNKKSEEGCGVCGRPRTYRVREGTNPLRLASHLAALRVEHVIPYLRQFPDPGGPRGPINARDAQGFTAVHVAAAAGNAEILQILIENGS